MTQVVAAFDCDGTLTYSDTLIGFLRFAFGTKATFLKMLLLLPKLALFPFGLLSRQKAKEIILTAFLQHFSQQEVEQMGKHFAEGPLNGYLKPQALERFQWHKRQGHACILISANLSFYLVPWGKGLGFRDVIASQLAVDKHYRVTGRLEGLNCYGSEKVMRLQKLLGPKSGYILYAYGDSKGDKELLELADFPFFRTFS